jgi:hypothetical protein
MTTIAGALEAAVVSARRLKEWQARRRCTDLPTAVLVYRGEVLVAQVFPEQANDRDAALRCAAASASGYGADVLVLVIETFHTELQTNPVTGRAWGQREMQEVADQHDGRAQGWVTDAVLVVAYNRAGDHGAQSLPYRVDAGGVSWLDVEAEAARPVTGWSGPVHDVLSEIMRGSTLGQELARSGLTGDGFGLNAEEERAHMDCAVTKVFAGWQAFLGPDAVPGYAHPRATVALAAEPGTVRERIIRRSMPGGRVIRP